MKGVFLFCSRLRVYWCEIPLAFLLTVCFIFNSKVDTLFRLYPLITVTIASMIFIFIYFFRMIRISYDEIRYIGRFSSRDAAVIVEGVVLSLELCERGKIRLSLIGNEGTLPGFDWIKSTGDAPKDISLFRGRAIGGAAAIGRVLRFFGAGKDESERFLKEDFERTYENVTVTSCVENEKRKIKIRMNKTV